MEKIPKQHPSNLVKVVLFGPESTGKTTLSRQLAEHYKTIWVPEFARDYLQKKWDTERKICEPKDIVPIAIGQMKLENEGVKQANQVVICDTDILETKVYSEQYYDHFVPTALEEAITKHQYDIYFLTYIDTPWTPDDLRDRPKQRQEMFIAFERALIENNRKYVLLKGNKETRFKKAVEIIDKLLLDKRQKEQR